MTGDHDLEMGGDLVDVAAGQVLAALLTDDLPRAGAPPVDRDGRG